MYGAAEAVGAHACFGNDGGGGTSKAWAFKDIVFELGSVQGRVAIFAPIVEETKSFGYYWLAVAVAALWHRG